MKWSDEKTELADLKFVKTTEHDCSYIKGEQASTLFLMPDQPINHSSFSELADYGFRRSGEHLYKPFCDNCQACIPVRLPVADFRPSRSQKRVRKKNQDLSISIATSIKLDEHYPLFEEYINVRHKDGDMYPTSPKQFEDFLLKSTPHTHYFQVRHHDKLIACCVVDLLEKGLSAIYTYFDVNLSQRSLGKFVILALIEHTQARSLPFLYLGYWIKECQKMNYKSDYRPMEIYHNNMWVNVN